MENLDLLIEIGIYVGALALGFAFAKISESAFTLIEHIKGLIIYRRCVKTNNLHTKESPYFKWWRKQELMKGTNPMETSFVAYEMHFIDEKFYF